MSGQRRLRLVLRDWAIAALGVAALALAAFIYFRDPGARTYRLTITAGRAAGVRHDLAEALAREAKGRGLILKVVETAGSERALDEVERGRIDLALVQGGLVTGERPRVRQVTALHVEPLHLLVKEEHLEAVSRNLGALRGKVINLGEVGSGTHALASDVLAFAGLKARADYTPETLSYEALLRESDRARLPDAAFMVSLLPSPVARRLVERHGYRLAPVPFGEAYALRREDAADPAEGVDRTHVDETTVPAFTYGVAPGVPDGPLRTLGTRLLVVARRDLDPGAVDRLIDVIFTTRIARSISPPLDPRLLDLPPEFEPHRGTLRYRERNKPVFVGDVVDSLEKGTSLAGALLGGAFFLWQWVRRRYRLKRDRGFEGYILKVTDVERRAMELELAPSLDLAELLRLQAELGRLKAEALETFARGDLDGEELMSSFLAHVNDARGYLARLILHERDNIEERASAEGRTPRALWDEAVGPRAAEDMSPIGP